MYKLFFIIFLKFAESFPIIVVDGNSKQIVFVVHLGSYFSLSRGKVTCQIAALQLNKACYTTALLKIFNDFVIVIISSLIACGGWSLPCYIDTGNKPKVCMFPCHETMKFN